MKKLILLIFLVMFLIPSSYATEPFPNEEYISKTGRYHIVLYPTSEQSLILSDKKENKDYSFSVEQFDLDFIHNNMMISTAGLGWYRNSIAVFNDEEIFFVIKLPWPQYVVVDLQKHVIVKDPSEILKDVAIMMNALALKWLDSEDPYQRQTAAIVCRDLKISESIPKLKELLSDKEFYTTYTGNNNEGTIVLYVRKAAKDALLALGENVENVITELPEKDCLKYDGNLGRYVIDWENEKCRRRK